MIGKKFTYTIFCQINAPGAEAQNEPLSESGFNEIDCHILLALTISVQNLIGVSLVVFEI